jgi:hypothetical protein
MICFTAAWTSPSVESWKKFKKFCCTSSVPLSSDRLSNNSNFDLLSILILILRGEREISPRSRAIKIGSEYLCSGVEPAYCHLEPGISHSQESCLYLLNCMFIELACHASNASDKCMLTRTRTGCHLSYQSTMLWLMSGTCRCTGDSLNLLQLTLVHAHLAMCLLASVIKANHVTCKASKIRPQLTHALNRQRLQRRYRSGSARCTVIYTEGLLRLNFRGIVMGAMGSMLFGFAEVEFT